MNIDDDQKSIQTLAILFEDLQCFLTQKVHQHIIFAFLQIKKTARKNRGLQMTPVDRRSIASVSQKNYSERKKSISGQGGRSLDKQSHASFDIIKGAQFFNDSRKKGGHYQKQYTQASKHDRGYLSNARQQLSGFASPYAQRGQQSLNIRENNQIVPKLVGLVSADQLSDIQRPARTVQSRDRQKKSQFRNYDQSIAEVDDDDDQFQDVVLNRLDKIQEKVNQMLKEKRQQRLQAASQKGPLTPNYRLPKPKLQNVGSGPNIIYSNHLRGHRNSEFYKYHDSRYKTSSDQIPNPITYTFQNSKNTSQNPSTKKILNQNMKPHFTERVPIASRFSSHIQNYMTDNEQNRDQYRDNQNIPRHRISMKQADTFQIYQNVPYQQENILQKNKKLGHYRESSGNLHDGKTVQSSQYPSYHRGQRIIQKNIDYSRLKQQGMIDGQYVYKYIPLSKLPPESRENLPQKTQRQIISRNRQLEDDQRGLKVVFLEQSKHSSRINHKNDNQIQRRGQVRDDSFRSGKNSGIRERQLQGSDVKAYTEQGDFIQNVDDFSVSSDGGIYSEIRELREITKLYGTGRDKKQNYGNQNQPYRQIVSRPPEDYRHHQKTERHKYIPSKNYSQHQQDQTEGQVIIQNGHPQQRMVRVMKEVPHYSQQVHVIPQQNRVAQQQYVEYITTEEPIVYRSAHQSQSGYNIQKVYVVRQSPQIYEKVQEKQLSYKPSNKSEVRTVIIRDDTNSESHRKLSSGSITSFKSIPYGRFESKKNSMKDCLVKEKSGSYVVEKQGNYDYTHEVEHNEY